MRTRQVSWHVTPCHWASSSNLSKDQPRSVLDPEDEGKTQLPNWTSRQSTRRQMPKDLNFLHHSSQNPNLVQINTNSGHIIAYRSACPQKRTQTAGLFLCQWPPDWHDRGFESHSEHGHSSLVFALCCAGSSVCEGLITDVEGSYCPCVPVCDLETSTVRQSEPKWGSCVTDRNSAVLFSNVGISWVLDRQADIYSTFTNERCRFKS
jgi:hypothetical protein